MFTWIESLSELGRYDETQTKLSEPQPIITKYLSKVYIDCEAWKVAWRFLMSCPIQWRGKQTT
jgi:hypothetical protein